VNPWSLHVLQHDDVDRRVAQTSDDVIRAVAAGIAQFVELENND
jgi:hypothetical protein